jgi:hypothetical protein
MVEFAIVNTMARVEIRRMSIKMRRKENKELPPDAVSVYTGYYNSRY